MATASELLFVFACAAILRWTWKERSVIASRSIPHRGWRLLLAYLASAGAFAGVYHAIYSLNEHSFAFAGSMHQSQRDDLQADLSRLEKFHAPLLHTLLGIVKGTPKVPTVEPGAFGWDTVRFESETDWFDFDLAPSWGRADDDNRLIARHLIRIADKKTGSYFQRPVHSEFPTLPAGIDAAEHDRLVEAAIRPSSIEWYRDAVATVEKQVDGEIASLRSQLKSLRAYRANFVDFLYFSVITQATVGYGDVLPNNTAVRIIVILQVMFSTAVAVFALGAILALRSE